MTSENTDGFQSRVSAQQEAETLVALARRELEAANHRIAQQLTEARDDASLRLADAERRANMLIEEAKGVASKEGAKIIAAAVEEARTQMIRHGESVDEDGGVQRIIEFPSELRQAGISILSYFSEILKQKYPDQDMAVRIEQFGTLVRMTIHSPAGWRDIVERDLATYGAIVVGEASPTSILKNEMDVMRLQNKLDLARVELEFEKRVNAITLANSSDRMASLEHQLDRLHGAIALSLTAKDSSFEGMTLLLNHYSSNHVVLQALHLLNEQLLQAPGLANRETTEAAAKVLSERDPSALRRVYEIFSSTGTGAAGNLLASWIESLLK